MKIKSLSFKLSLYILTTVSVTFVVIFLFNLSESRKDALENMKRESYYISQSTAYRIESVLRGAEEIAFNLARLLEKQPGISQMQLEERIKTLVFANPEIFGCCVAYEPYSFFRDSLYYAPYAFHSGDTVSFMQIGNDSYNYFYLDWYQIPRELNQPLWSEPYFDANAGNIMMATYSAPIWHVRNGKPEILAIVTIDIDLQYLSRMVSDIRIFDHGYAFLVSKQGTFITHPVKDFISNETVFTLAEEYNQPYLREAGRDMISGGSGYQEVEPVTRKGDKYLMTYMPIPASGWSVAVLIPKDELYAPVYRLQRLMIALAAAGLFLLLVLISAIARRLTNPVKELAEAAHEIGSGNLEHKVPQFSFHNEITDLANSFRKMQTDLRIHIAAISDATAAREKIESELKIARDIQQGIVPKVFPPFADHPEIDLHAVLDSAREVGGDLYDFFFIDDVHLCFAVGDVSGKGIPASLLMAITRTLLRARTAPDMKPCQITSSINIELCRENDNAMFVTFFIGIVNLKTGQLDYCNAGHNRPWVLDSNGAISQLPQTHGTPLGLFDDMEYGCSSVVLGKGSSVVLYTDGVTEAMNEQGELFGDEQLIEALRACNGAPPKQIISEVYGQTKKFVGIAPQSDDITLLVFQLLDYKK